MKATRNAVFLAASLACMLACKDSRFAGKGGATADPTPVPQTAQPPPPPTAPTAATQATPAGVAPILTDGGSGVRPNYTGCAALPGAGKVKYPAKCSDNQVVVIVNDGSAQEMSCCPLNGSNIFSSNSAELFQERPGHCLADEVAVGMISANDSRLYCSKINTAFLKLGPVQKAQYISGLSNVSPQLQAIAQSYNINDTCVCPPQTVILGGHTAADNVCNDDCAEIQLK